MTSKPTLLLLGDPTKTIRWRNVQFDKFSTPFNVKVIVDLTRDAFETALREKKYPPHIQLMRYGDFVAMMKPMVEYGTEFGRLDKDLIELLPRSLKVIAAGGAGFDWVDHEELGRKGAFCLLGWVIDGRDLVL
jgi:hypothetical protein